MTTLTTALPLQQCDCCGAMVRRTHRCFTSWGLETFACPKCLHLEDESEDQPE